MKQISYSDTLYEFKIILTLGTWKEFCDYLEKEELTMFLGVPSNTITGPAGYHFAIPELNEAYMFVNVGKNRDYDSQMQTFVHELNHACLDIFDTRGIPVSSDYSEAYCYYYDYLYSYFSER